MRRGVPNSVLMAVSSSLMIDDDAGARAQDVEIVADLGAERLELIADLVAAERGQPLQAKIEDGAGLLLRQAIRPRGRDLVARIGDQLDERDDVLGRPVTRHQLLPRRAGSGAARISLMISSILATAMARPTRICARSRALRSRNLVRRPTTSSRNVGEGADQVFEVELLGLAADQRHHVAAERALQRGEAVQLVQHDIGHGVALKLDHHAHALAIGFVADVGDALDLLVAHIFGDLLDHRRLVHLIGNLGDDERLALLADGLVVHPPAHHDRAAALVIGRADACLAEDHAAGRKVGTGHELGELIDRDGRIVEIGDACVDHLAEIMRRDVGRHADGDAPCPVDKKVGELRGKNRWLLEPVVVVRLEVDRVLVEIVEQELGDLGEPRLGITLCRRWIAVDRAEIALSVDQRQAHGKLLRHAHQRVVNGEVTVRVEVAHRIADDLGRLHMLLVEVEPEPLHGKQNAPMHRLQPVAHVGQSARHDHAHGVIEIRPLHLIDERDRSDVGGGRPLDVVILVVCQRRRTPVPKLEAGKASADREGKLSRARGESDCVRTLLYS